MLLSMYRWLLTILNSDCSLHVHVESTTSKSQLDEDPTAMGQPSARVEVEAEQYHVKMQDISTSLPGLPAQPGLSKVHLDILLQEMPHPSLKQRVEAWRNGSLLHCWEATFESSMDDIVICDKEQGDNRLVSAAEPLVSGDGMSSMRIEDRDMYTHAELLAGVGFWTREQRHNLF